MLLKITRITLLAPMNRNGRNVLKKVAARFYDLTDFIVNKLGVTDIGAHLAGRAVYHPSCSLSVNSVL